MNRAEFMQQLGTLLGDLPVSERTEALKYYADYFDEAGTENEAQVLKELGTPEEVAKVIKAELNTKDKESGEFTESGYKNPAYASGQTPVVNTTGQTGNTQSTYTPPKNNTWKTALIVVLCILLIPIGAPVAIAVISTVLSIIAAIFSALFGLIIGFAALAAGLIAVAIIVAIIASVNLTTLPFASFVLYGGALLLAALGILFVLLTFLLCAKALPAIFRAVVYVCGLPFRKKEVIV